MKTFHASPTRIMIFLICVACIGCEKDNPQQPPLGIQNSIGLLATIGVNSTGKTDTICFRIGSSGTSYGLTDLTVRARTGGFLERPKDLIELAATGNGNWTFTNNKGNRFKLGDKENVGGNFTNRHHLSYSYNLSDSAQFVANDAGDGTFYIESVLHRGLYLITEPPNVQPPRKSHENLRFDPVKKQKWFIVPW